jgi:hypothetical protein
MSHEKLLNEEFRAAKRRMRSEGVHAFDDVETTKREE